MPHPLLRRICSSMWSSVGSGLRSCLWARKYLPFGLILCPADISRLAHVNLVNGTCDLSLLTPRLSNSDVLLSSWLCPFARLNLTLERLRQEDMHHCPWVKWWARKRSHPRKCLPSLGPSSTLIRYPPIIDCTNLWFFRWEKGKLCN